MIMGDHIVALMHAEPCHRHHPSADQQQLLALAASTLTHIAVQMRRLKILRPMSTTPRHRHHMIHTR